MPATNRISSYCRYKATEQACVKIDGKRHSLGKHNFPESKARYRELIGEWRLRVDPDSRIELMVGELVLLLLDHARSYSVKDCRQAAEVGCFEVAVRFMLPYRRTRAEDFGPLMLKAARDAMVNADLARTTINRQAGRIRHIFRWAVAEQLVRPDILVVLEAVRPLKEGCCQAREHANVRRHKNTSIDNTFPSHSHSSPTARYSGRKR